MSLKISKSEENQDIQTIFVLYELGQVEEFERYARQRPEAFVRSAVIALSLDIEMKLAERSIPHASGRQYKKIFPDQLTVEDEMITDFFADRRWKDFIYRGVVLRATFQFMFRSYLQRVRYYGHFLISILESHPSITHLVFFAPSEVISETFGTLARREINVVIDCAKIVASTRNVSVKVMSLSVMTTSLRNSFRPRFFNFQRSLFGLFLWVWNMSMTILRHSRHPRLLISDYWRNVGSAFEFIKEAQCLFLDRTEIRHIYWRSLLHYQMQFVHAENFLTPKMRELARDGAKKFSKMWSDMKEKITPTFVYRGYSFDTLLINALDDLVGHFEKTLGDIEGTYALYTKVRPDLVLLRASVSSQTHFSILPLVAKVCGIPSLELQHGLEYLGVGSWSREHVAEYIAVYGSLVKNELVLLGYPSENARVIGSPRFDCFLNKVSQDRVEGRQRPFTILCITPDIRPFEIYDSYSAEDYFKALASAVENFGDVKLIFKLRPGPADESFFRRLIANTFTQVPYTIAQYESLSELCTEADMAVSCFSTAVLEVLQLDLPVVIPALNPVDASVVNFHFARYREGGVLAIAYTQREFTQIITKLATHPETCIAMRAKAREFLTRHFCFDGQSSQRLAEFITELSSLKAEKYFMQ